MRWLFSELCYVTAANQWTFVEIELLATVGWKCGCQPFSWPCSKHVTHCRTEICSTRLFKESIPAIPFWEFQASTPYQKQVPESGSTLHPLSTTVASCHPFVATVEKNLSHAEKQRVWSRSCGLQDLLEDNTAIELWVVCVTFANLWTLVEIELLATVGWKWGCQPFSRPCSENAMRRRTEICSTCLSKESTPPIPFGNSNSKHPLPARSRFPRAAYTLPALHYACTMLAKDSI